MDVTRSLLWLGKCCGWHIVTCSYSFCYIPHGYSVNDIHEAEVNCSELVALRDSSSCSLNLQECYLLSWEAPVVWHSSGPSMAVLPSSLCQPIFRLLLSRHSWVPVAQWWAVCVASHAQGCHALDLWVHDVPIKVHHHVHSPVDKVTIPETHFSCVHIDIVGPLPPFMWCLLSFMCNW